MGEGDAELLPPNKGEQKSPNIVINQFFQLVNQHNTLPDGESLSGYTPEDKQWIKERVNHEQEQRLLLFHKYMDHQMAMEVSANERNSQSARRLQWGALVIVGIAVLCAAILLYLKVGWLALGLPAVVLIPGVASGLTDVIIQRLKSSPKDKATEK
jgi:hypothetical protein